MQKLETEKRRLEKLVKEMEMKNLHYMQNYERVIDSHEKEKRYHDVAHPLLWRHYIRNYDVTISATMTSLIPLLWRH